MPTEKPGANSALRGIVDEPRISATLLAQKNLSILLDTPSL